MPDRERRTSRSLVRWRQRWLAGMLLVMATLDTAAAQLMCDRPDPPLVLDGYLASYEEMVVAGEEMEDYAELMQEYLDCLQRRGRRRDRRTGPRSVSSGTTPSRTSTTVGDNWE